MNADVEQLEKLIHESAKRVQKLNSDNTMLLQETQRLRMMLSEQQGLEGRNRRLRDRLKKLISRLDKEITRS